MALALYRRYRPDTFDGVIGQDQVVVPLSRALDEGKLTHAYLFSGPRGCGKTSSARILARCINCEKGPTSHPCGVCESCRDLSAGGAGSIDVVEIDAASHNGVEDARELRERAGFAPARDRYKIFILDEAHMVTQQGFNALLKIVEEPPEHVMFIFATTEPEKVIGTIRSRTHHYPFRLVPPEIMGPYLQKVCEEEKITPRPGVLKLAMRAGGGSVRDTLSVLDQLMVGSEKGTITYASASALLGYTPEALISQALDAVIDKDGSSLYSTVEKVVVGGFEPRRFVEDLLSRVRDLLVLTLAGKQAVGVFSEAAEGEDTSALARQAKALGLHKLTTIAEKINDTLATMSGATSPRMRLELLAAQLLAAMDTTGSATAGASTLVADGATKGGSDQTGGAGAQSSAGQPSGRIGFNPPPRKGSPSQARQTSPSGSATPGSESTSAPQAPRMSGASNVSAASDGAAESRQSQTSPEPVAPATATMQPMSADQPTPVVQPTSATQQAQQSLAPSEQPRSDLDLWRMVVAQMPSSLSTYVDKTKIPIVEFKQNRFGGKHLVFTFDTPMSQHVFAMAVTSQNQKVPTLVQREVRKVFGDNASIAPNTVAANGEVVQIVRNMTPQQQAVLKREIAVRAMQGALAQTSGFAKSATPSQVPAETSSQIASTGAAASTRSADASERQGDGSAAGAGAAEVDSDSDSHHRAGSGVSADSGAANGASNDALSASAAMTVKAASSAGSSNDSDDDDDDDPWAQPEPEERLEPKEQSAATVPSPRSVAAADATMSAAATAGGNSESSATFGGIPVGEAPDDDDPWANAEPEPEPEPEREATSPYGQQQGSGRAPNRGEASRTDSSAFAGTARNGGDSRQQYGPSASSATATSAVSSSDSFAASAASGTPAVPAEPTVNAEDDTYSLNDESLGASDRVDIDELKRIFDVREVREIPPDEAQTR